MIPVYAVTLVMALVGLIGWIVAAALAVNLGRPRLDPERRFGGVGRRVVAATFGFGIAGLSAEYSPLGLAWPLALALAVAGGAAAAWYAGRIVAGEREPG